MSDDDSPHYVSNYRTFAKPELIYTKRNDDGTWDDGWPHERGDNEWCKNCMAPPGIPHARLKQKTKEVE